MPSQEWGPGMGPSESLTHADPVSLVTNCTQMWINWPRWGMQAITRKNISLFKANQHIHVPNPQSWSSKFCSNQLRLLISTQSQGLRMIFSLLWKLLEDEWASGHFLICLALPVDVTTPNHILSKDRTGRKKRASERLSLTIMTLFFHGFHEYIWKTRKDM